MNTVVPLFFLLWDPWPVGTPERVQTWPSCPALQTWRRLHWPSAAFELHLLAESGHLQKKIWLLHIHVFCLIEANSWLQFTMTRSQGQNFYQSQGQDYNLMLWLLLLWKMNLTETEIFFNELDKWKNIFFTSLKLRVMVIILTILHLYSHLVFSIMIIYLLCLCS